MKLSRDFIFNTLIGYCFEDFAKGGITEEESERRMDEIEMAGEEKLRRLYERYKKDRTNGRD